MEIKIILKLALAAIVMAAVPGRAATMSANATAPAVDNEDIANYGDVTGTDKWFTGTDGASSAKGQTFTTGNSSLRLRSITYQVADSQKAEPTKTYTIRVGKVAGTNFTQVHSESATQNFTWNAGEFMTWTFDTPLILEPYTTYGIDVGMRTSTSAWQTGIPYINMTADEYPGGERYSSGTSGVGTSTVSIAISSDRVFHLDIERPLGTAFALAATYPVDNASDVLASRNLVLTFSQSVTPGTGNLTIRNLTDGTDIQLPANDPRLTYDQNVVRIHPAGLLSWSRNYAIRIDAGTFLGDGGAPIAAITNDTAWNFTTAAGDPLLDAIAALKNHITGSATLTGPQIAAQKAVIDNQRQGFADNAINIAAVFDLITTYDAIMKPLFVTGSTVTDFSRNNTNPADKKSVSPENLHWVIYTVMQHAMDMIYTAPVLAEHEALLNGFKFGSHASFPGPCTPPANPNASHTVPIQGSFPRTFGRDTQQWTLPARKPTGTYLAPGTIATITVPPGLVNKGYSVRVGAHSWDLSGRPPVQRLERATRLYPITAETIKVASPYGGGIYIEVPIGANAGVVHVTVTGAVRAPFFSAKSFHQTTAAEWNVEKTHPAPWADFQSDKFMVQVPRRWIYNHPSPAQMMADWDKAMDVINDLMGFPRDRGKETMYCQVDIIMRSSVHAPGYPAVNVTGSPNSEVSPAGYSGSYLVRGPGASVTAANTEFHEQGHAYFFPKFGGETESNVNLLQPAMLHRAFGYDMDTAHRGSLGSGRTFQTIDNTAVAWMCVFNFSPRKVPMAEAEKAYQLKGHAKFMDIARLFGWDGLDTYWRSFMEDDANGVSYTTGTDALLLRLSRSVDRDIRPLFHFWGIHPQNPATLAAAIKAENIPPSIEIRNLLRRYKTLVPANNAAFRTFAQSWWGKQPSINGYWEEREHARQWDSTPLYNAGDQQRTDATNPGEIYNEYSAGDIRARIDELLASYFPPGVAPDPMTFASPPAPVGPFSVGMTATTASSSVAGIQYFFENINTGAHSGWQSAATWTNSGLTSGATYSYRVKARDADLTETAWSATASATVPADTSPPSPDPMSFSLPPTTAGFHSITMTATTASDINGVEYYFECVSGGGNDSGWQDSPVYTDTGLAQNTEYGYRVRARDKSMAQNMTGFCETSVARTAVLDGEPPTLVGIQDDRNGTPVDVHQPVIYHVTFSEAMKAVSIGTDDFANAGTAALTVNHVEEVTPAVFLVDATPSTPGTLRLQIPAGAVLSDTAGNPLDTTTARPDDTVITVIDPTPEHPYNAWSGSLPADEDSNGDGIANALAWVLGAADPMARATALLPTLDTTTDPDGKLLFIFRRTAAAGADPDTAITAQFGSDLDEWFTAVHQGNGPSEITITELTDGFAPGIDKVTVALPAGLTGKDNFFVRLKVDLAP